MRRRRTKSALEELQEIADLRDEHGHHTAWLQLLEQYGMWCRKGTGEPRYRTPLGARYVPEEDAARPPVKLSITDDEAMLLNSCISQASAFNRKGLIIFRMVFERGVDVAFVDKCPLVRVAFRVEKMHLTPTIARLIFEEFVEKVRRKLLAIR